MKRPPTKHEAFVKALIERKSINTFEANRIYGDTCLHSTISGFEKRHAVSIPRKAERVKTRHGKHVTVMRYHLSDIESMKAVLAKLRKARGL